MEVPGRTLFPKGLESGSVGQREKSTQGLSKKEKEVTNVRTVLMKWWEEV